MPNTEQMNPTSFAMVRTIFLFLTLWFFTVSSGLPNINGYSLESEVKDLFSPSPYSSTESGKCIKATENLVHPPDSNLLVIVPEFKLADPNNYRIRTVVIDPGHGGHDPGCSGHGSKEKDIVLAVGKFLRENLRLHYPNLNVMMTRSTDVFVPLHQRASLANHHHADLFISIHCNAFSRSSAKGTETYVLGLHATDENLEVAKRENESILLEDNYEQNYGYDPNSPEAHIMLSMFQNAFLEQSISFAEKVQRQAHRNTGLNNRGVKQAGFLVLRHTTMPSVLVETGYLTNATDEAYLETTNGQRAMADALLDAFTEYKKDLEKSGAEAPAVVSFVEREKKEIKPAPTVIKPVQRTIADDKVINNKGGSIKNFPPPPAPTKAKKEIPVVKKQPVAQTNISPKKHAKIAPTNPVKSTATHTSTTVSASNSSTAINFCIQLAASPQLLDVGTGKWRKMQHTVEVIYEANLYKYQVRNFATFEEANRVRRDLRAQGFSDAYLVAYKNGQKVNPYKVR